MQPLLREKSSKQISLSLHFGKEPAITVLTGFNLVAYVFHALFSSLSSAYLGGNTVVTLVKYFVGLLLLLAPEPV